MWLSVVFFVLISIIKSRLQITQHKSTSSRNLTDLQWRHYPKIEIPVNQTQCCSRSTYYSAEEIYKIRQLREMTKDLLFFVNDEYMQRDHFILRWLRARNLDVDAAYQMAREAAQWRIDNQIDKILNEENILPNIKDAYKFQGHDKEGRPILLLTPTYLDARKILLGGKWASALRCYDQMLERAFYLLRNLKTRMTNGEEVLDFVVILDVEGYSFKQHACLQCLALYWEFLQHLQRYYPEAVKYFVVINMKKAALPVLNAIRPFAVPSSERALRIFGSHRPEWTEFLLSIISADQLSYRFGGTRAENDVSEHSYKFR